ncbi:RNA polymerase sigma factor [Pontibacter sp. H249]|uniref:RNA polymerase sigma factor n=1 Tax=Pontibacter sp. H249 TaxID=3133420 RepID=UPI0030BDC2B1
MSEINFEGENEEALIASIRQGRQEALGKLYDAYAPMMLGVITRIVQDKEVAEEVLSETFVAIWSRIGIYNSSKERLLTWGLAIARGIALEAVKTNRYKNLIKPSIKSVENNVLQNFDVTLRKDQPKKQDLCNLAPLERTVLELLYLKGRSCPEIAGELKMTEAEVKEILKSAFTQLKAEKPI